MNYYISDMHFGHKKVIAFDDRPFSNRDEMDQYMIERWNGRVEKDDHVYVIGDFCYKSSKSPEWYLNKLQGHKHLIIGNHDWRMLKNEKAMSFFESVENIMHVVDYGEDIYLCHYPLAQWNGERYGSWHIYGHIHKDQGDVYHFMKRKIHALNAAACINKYTPATFEELIYNNNAYQRL